MILLYQLLENNRDKIIAALVRKIPKESHRYARVPRSQLRESIEYLYDAYLDFLVSGDNTNLKVIFKYVARIRVAQSFPLHAILRAFLCFVPVIREVLQDEFRKLDDGSSLQFNRAMNQIECSAFDSVAVFSDVFQDYIQSQIDEHNEYLLEKNQQLGLDLSKFILFRG